MYLVDTKLVAHLIARWQAISFPGAKTQHGAITELKLDKKNLHDACGGEGGRTSMVTSGHIRACNLWTPERYCLWLLPFIEMRTRFFLFFCTFTFL